MENISDEILNSFIGMDREICVSICLEKNYKVRVTREDSTNYIVTCDLRFDRVNLEIDNGKVTKCGLG